MPRRTRKTEFVMVGLTPQARDVLRALALRVSVTAGRKVSMSDALLATVQLSEPDSDPAHPA